MNKFLTFLFLLCFPLVAFAYCSSSELSRYKSLAAHINSYYEYDGNLM